ncbi:DMT family transporter [Clostridium sp. 19966]|uniref:DMT family transporter n=1 Tax=Clostridium sp. 19966 TaxID=2768166 RepID=UPI0028F04E11|nr:DMT family transporter [Clostridium sp. 19966]
MILSSAIFGLSFLFTKRALTVAAPLQIVSFRFLLAFIVMSILVLLRIIKVDYKNKPIKWLVILSLFEPVIYFIFETYGLKFASSSIGGLMISLIPIAVTILGIYFLNEVPSLKRSIFIGISVLGVIIIALFGSSDGGNGTSLWGILLLIGAVVSAGFFTITSRKISKAFTPLEITYFMMFLGTLCFNIMNLIQMGTEGNLKDYFKPLASATFIESMVYLAILSSIIAYFLVNFSLSKLEASIASVFSNISTIVSIIAGVVLLGESFHYYHLIGSALILIGVWGTNSNK